MSEHEDSLAAVAAEVRICTQCPLSLTRTLAVPGEGPSEPEILFIGEGPGYHEDRQGRPFVGASGRFLEELLASVGLQREQVFITSVVKCRPPKNRDPHPKEIGACSSYLDRQLGLLQPKIIVTLGRFSMARFFPGQSISQIHGQAKREGKYIILPMFHPAAALHRQDLMETVRQDMLKLLPLIEVIRQEAPAGKPGDALASTQPDPEEPEAQQLSLFG